MKYRYLSLLFAIFIFACSGMSHQAAAASEEITISVDGVPVSLAVQPEYDNAQQIMVPVKALTAALGGASTDISMTLFTYPAVALNDRGIVFDTTAESYFTLPLAPEDLPFQDTDNLTFSFLQNLMVQMIYGGQIGICAITFPYYEVPGDIYLPLSTYAQLFQLSYTASGSTVDFKSGYTEYARPAFQEAATPGGKQQLTFSVNLTNKTYDGTPYSWDVNTLEAYCDGKKVNEHLSLHFSYKDVGQSDEVLSEQPPTQAGTYHLIVSVDPNDGKYTGENEFPFFISAAEIVLTAKDVQITAGDALPEFLYDVKRRGDGMTVRDALYELPVLSIRGGLSSTSDAGTYEIVVTGGVPTDNYIISERVSGKLTIVEPAQPTSPSVSPSGQAPVQPAAGMDWHKAYITGYTDHTFRPENPLTRSECAVLLSRIEEIPSSNTVSFADVDRGAWYYEEVQALAGAGIINGYTDHTFRADNPVTRAEFLAMALRLLDVEPTSGGETFSDVSPSHWAAAYIRTAAGQGIVSGYPDGTFRPDQTVTRAEAAKIINQITGRDTCGFHEYQASFSDVLPGYWAYDAIMCAANDHNHIF